MSVTPVTEIRFSMLMSIGPRGTVLQSFVDLLPNIKTLLSTRNEVQEGLSNDAWLLDLGN